MSHEGSHGLLCSHFCLQDKARSLAPMPYLDSPDDWLRRGAPGGESSCRFASRQRMQPSSSPYWMRHLLRSAALPRLQGKVRKGLWDAGGEEMKVWANMASFLPVAATF